MVEKKKVTPKQKAVIITTQHRGVFFGYVSEKADMTKKIITDVKGARMAIYWGTTKGLMELAQTGPTSKSKISSPADIPCLQDVTAVFSVTAEAEQKWITV